MPQLNTVNAFDYLQIALFFGIVIWVGFFSARKNRGTKDFFQANESVPWFMAAVSTWVSGFSAFMFIAAAGEIYRNGASATLLFTSAFFAYLGGYAYFAAAWRRARISAPLDFLTRRFSPSTTYIYSVIFIPIGVVAIGTGLYTISLFVSSALGLDRELFSFAGLNLSGVELCILLIGVTMIIYSSMGGLWAAVLSDSVQGLIVAIMSVLLLPISLRYLGSGDVFAGVKRMVTELPFDFLVPHTGQRGWLFFVAYALFNFVIYNAAWHQVQRYNSVPGERDARKMAMLCAWLSLFGPLLWILPVMTARLIFPDIALFWPNVNQPEEVAFVSLALLLLPHGMIGFVVAAILSTAMGKANDVFNWLSASVTRDVYVPLRRRFVATPIADVAEMRVAQLVMVALGLCAIVVAFLIGRWGKGVFNFVLFFSSISDIPLYLPVMLGLMYRRTPWWSCLVCCGVGLTVTVALTLSDFMTQNQGYERNVFGGSIAVIVTFVITACFYRAKDPRNAGIEKLDADMRLPMLPAGDVAPGGALPMYRVIGNISLMLGLVLAIGALLPGDSGVSPWINALAGALLGLIGAALRWYANPARTTAGS